MKKEGLKFMKNRQQISQSSTLTNKYVVMA